ncbi:MAG: hypothetical protein ACFWT6_11380 [Virgibacillus proomii]|jgi:hypothetical protein
MLQSICNSLFHRIERRPGSFIAYFYTFGKYVLRLSRNTKNVTVQRISVTKGSFMPKASPEHSVCYGYIKNMYLEQRCRP